MIEPAPDLRGHPPGTPGFLAELRYLPDANDAVDQEHLVGRKQLIDADVRDADGDVIAAREPDHQFALHSGDPATRKIRRHQLATADREHIGHGAANHVVVSVTQQAFGDPGIAPFRARQHVFETVQVFDPCQCRLRRQPYPAQLHAHAVVVMTLRIVRQGTRGNHAYRRRGGRRCIAALAGPARDDDPDDTVRKARRNHGQVALENIGGRTCYAQHSAIGREFRVVTWPQQRFAAVQRESAEYAVAVRQPAIANADRVALNAIDEVHCDTGLGPREWPAEQRGQRRQTARNTRLPLVPPKPNEFESATLIFILRAVFGT